ncbi:MAG: PKD-like family lipoprotein [Odoribacter splanchnicus]
MNKIINILFTVPLVWALASCYDDKGNYDYTELDKVAISMQDTVYATQFRTLELDADILFEGASEEDYTFNWRLWSNNIGGTNNKKEIGNKRKLSYNVEEIAGSYTLALTVTNKATEVNSYKTALLMVQSNITEGLMVLHEKDGKSDFDLVMSPYFSQRVQQDEILHNVYETVNGEPLEGRGVSIGSYFSKGRYQDVTILTDKGGVRLSAFTMQRSYDMSTLFTSLNNWKPENYIFWNYYWSPGSEGYDAIISNGHFYMYNPIGQLTGDFTTYTEPILKNGLTYKASPYVPKWIDMFANHGVIYDELAGRFLGVERSTWILRPLPEATEVQPFDWSNMHATLRYMDTGYGKHEFGLFENWDSHELALYEFNFDVSPNIGVAKYPASHCPNLKDAKFYAVGDLGPLFMYADDRNLYRFDYNGSKNEEKLYTLQKADEKITGMQILKIYIDRFIPTHPFNNKIVLISTYNESTKEGKVYMYYINVTNGAVDLSSEKVLDGFGEILDMEWNYPKYI